MPYLIIDGVYISVGDKRVRKEEGEFRVEMAKKQRKKPGIDMGSEGMFRALRITFHWTGG